jgi:hypothetical protein
LVGATNVSAATPNPAKPAVVSSVYEEVPVTTAIVASSAPTAAAETPPPPPPPPTAHSYPVTPDDVQIGDALVIERGEQPADPSTQIGDTVTYER